MAEEISDNLYDISQEVRTLVEEHRNEIEKTDVPYAKLEILEFDYDDFLEFMSEMASNEQSSFDPSDPHLVLSDEEITKQEWNSQDRYKYIIEEIEDTEEYEEVESILNDRFGEEHELTEDNRMPTPNPHFLFHSFLTKITDNYLENAEIEEKEIVNLISSFTSEIERPPIEWNPTIFINGLALSDEAINISENLNIRRPTVEDLEQEIRMDSPWHRMGSFLPSGNSPLAVIEYETRAKNERELLNQINEIISTMRLFRVGSIHHLGFEPNPNSPLRESRQSWDRERIEIPFLYIVDQSDNEELSDFFTLIRPKLTEQILSPDKENYLTIAYDRYENSLLDDSSPESRLVSSIMALEAIYLSENEEGELSERLAQRTGLVLSLFDNPPIKVYNRVKSAYNIRSNYVHGSKIDEEDRKGLSTLEERIAIYTRKSIVVQLQARASWDKSEFLSKVDNAILDAGARDDFEEEMREHCEYWHS